MHVHGKYDGKETKAEIRFLQKNKQNRTERQRSWFGTRKAKRL
ncbi:hypothetical protein [Exilibacterium tricleocarpae]